MKYLLFLVVILGLSSAAHADCVPAKQAVTNLLQNGFAMEIVFELDHKPTAIFVNQRGDWIELSFSENDACLVASGRGFGFVYERKA